MPRRATGRSKKDRQREKRRAQRMRQRVERERALGALIEQVGQDTALLRNRDIPPEEAAAALDRLFPFHLPSRDIGAALIESIGPERARAIVEVALGGEPSPAALALAADLALAVGDADAAAAHAIQAQDMADDADLGLRLAVARARQGRLVDALQELRRALAAGPGLETGQLLRGELLQRLAGWEVNSPHDCPCGSGRQYAACCRDAAAYLLAEFRDREPLYALQLAVDAFVDRMPELRRHVRDSLQEWVDEDAMDPTGADEQASGLVRLALDRAWTAPIDDDEDTVLAEFADDPQTPSEQADRAAEWGHWARWGLWQVDELADPGVLLTEYLTGRCLYADMGAEQRVGLRRWSVLLGCFGSIDGIWRSGSSFVQLSPAEAMLVARQALWFVERVARKTDARNRPIVDWAKGVGQQVEEGRWLPDRASPAPKAIAEAIRNIVSVVLPRLVAEARRLSRTQPRLTNTDGDSLELIEARIAVADAGAARGALLAQADFEADGEEVRWYGDEMPEAVRQQMLERVQAEGLELDDAPEGPQRWVRGSVRVDGGELRVQVNSRGRLERLLARLAELGHPARVVEQQVNDVAEELRRPAQVPPAGPALGDVPPDEPIPLLDGLTLREAAARDGYAERLEFFLRELEHRQGAMPELRRELAAQPAEPGPLVRLGRDRHNMVGD